jgi:hypothetical protein
MGLNMMDIKARARKIRKSIFKFTLRLKIPEFLTLDGYFHLPLFVKNWRHLNQTFPAIKKDQKVFKY